MIRYAILGVGGLVIGTGETPNVLDALASGAGLGEVLLIGPNDRPEGHFWDGEAFRPLPPQPGPWAVWDGQAWTDPRTPADFAAALQSARNAAQRDKSGLLMDLRAMGILTAAEAVQAARGDIPDSFEAALSTMPQEAQDMARIKWAGDQVISRTNPLILLAAFAKGITDQQLDAAFGVQTPE
jgi:hypothetical protein